MNQESVFRAALAVGFLAVLAIALPHRLKSWASKERLDRRQEGLFILVTLRPVGLALWLGVIAYLINPAWMAWSSVPLPTWLRWTGVPVFALAVGLLAWTLRSLGTNLTDTVVTRRAHTLVTHGPYRWIRHPFYDAVALVILASALIAANWFVLVAGVVVFSLLAIRVTTEEAKLSERFGDTYRAYRERTGRFLPKLFLFVGCLLLVGCGGPRRSEGEKLARTRCATCHAFPEPHLLTKDAWRTGVLPQMAPRLGVSTSGSFNEALRNPHMTVLPKGASAGEWEQIVRYYLDHSPDSLPDQSLPAEPQVDPDRFKTGPFVPRMQSSSIITLLETDTARGRLFVGEAGSNTLRIFDWNRRLLSTVRLDSPPTDLIVENDRVLVLESGILNPNDEPKGSLVEYTFAGPDSLRFQRVLIDSLFRPVFVGEFGPNDFLICEFGDNRGRLALYRYDGSKYLRQVLDPSPGAIRFEIRDMNGDGHPDIVALLAQGDERIVLFENDGKWGFAGRQRTLARFPPVYGSMYFAMHDFNGDGHLDIVYVNGDNFDYSRVLKPYHGVRILENDGQNRFVERYFFPVYGAARAEVADFDRDGDLDIVTTSNFADFARHPERGIMFLENTGRYTFQPYAFTIASGNQWNLMATGDLNRDGRLDVIIGAMNLGNIAQLQRRSRRPVEAGEPVLVFENRMPTKE